MYISGYNPEPGIRGQRESGQDDAASEAKRGHEPSQAKAKAKRRAQVPPR